MAVMSEVVPGAVFGELTVLGRCVRSWKSYALCACNCGNVKLVIASTLGKYTKTCGCKIGKPSRAPFRTGRLSAAERKEQTGRSRAYKAWDSMWTRTVWSDCNARNSKYEFFQPPSAWLDFKQFYADMGDCPEGYSLDREDTRLGYSPDNCRWATRKEQAENREFVHNYYNGELLLTEDGLAKHLGLSKNGLAYHRSKGREPEGWRKVSYSEAVEIRKLIRKASQTLKTPDVSCPPTQPL